jgi:hypothetical protein
MPKLTQTLNQANPKNSAFNLVLELGATLLITLTPPAPVEEQPVPQVQLGGQQPPPILLSQVFHPAAGHAPVPKEFETSAVPVITWVVTYVEPPDVTLPTDTPIDTPLVTIVDDEAEGQLVLEQSLPIWQQPGI